MTLDEYFGDQADSRLLFDALYSLIDTLGETTCRVTQSQVAFRRQKAFAWAWMPAKYLHGEVAPLVLSVSLPGRDSSPRWKEIVETAPGRYMHHLELNSLDDLDKQVVEWVRCAWENAA